MFRPNISKLKKLFASYKGDLATFVGSYLVISFSHKLYLHYQKQANQARTFGGPSLPPRQQPLPWYFDVNDIKIKPYSQTTYCEQEKSEGICMGASIVGVTEPGSQDEKYAASVQEKYCHERYCHERYLTYINRDNNGLDSDTTKILWNVFEGDSNIFHFDNMDDVLDWDSAVTSKILSDEFAMKEENIKYIRIKSKGTSPSELDEFYSHVSRVVSQDETKKPCSVFIGIDTNENDGSQSGTHALRFNFFGNNRCSAYDANGGQLEGPCPQIQEIFAHLLKDYYATRAELHYIPRVDRPKNRLKEKAADGQSSETKPKKPFG